MKSVTIILQAYCPSISPKIDYSYSKSCDLYMISDLSSFKEYVVELIVSNQDSYLTVIIEYKDKKDIVKVLRYLRDHEKLQNIVSNSKHIYSSAAVHYKGDDRNLEDSSGEFEIPLPFELVVLCWDRDLDRLSESTIYDQQYLRVLTLLHGGSFLLVDNEKSAISLVYSVEWISDLLEKILVQRTKHLSYCEPKPVYDPQSLIRILIPSGWDSWSKIKLLESSFRGANGNSLLKDDVNIQDVVTAYKAISGEEKEEKEDREIVGSAQSNGVNYQEFLSNLSHKIK
ncbi:hypothetical protein CLIB1423_05S00254 [[Candida] railenensis]|uniref:Uncharacterized protein n=1 Tax=[Candida] railenensis TaxID=45579 RepID=A0A9P0QNB4_9ASCO|nr:hypothetical protein CLIB1423_05S00254 [[Candida] railenensis]